MPKTRKEIPTFFSFEIGVIRQKAETMSNEEWAIWSKKALNDLSIGCVKSDTDDMVVAVYERAKKNLEDSQKRNSRYYEKNKDKKQTEPNNEVNFGKTEQPQPEQSELLQVPPKPKVEKKKYGEFENVALTDDEVSKLQSRCNTLQINFNDVVSILSNYKAQKGTKYKSDYAAILNWVLNRCVEEKAKKESSANNYKSAAERERERNASFVGSLLTNEQRKKYGLPPIIQG